MNHFQLPYIREKHRTTARYGNVATTALINMMINDGSQREDLEAQIFGGAHDPEVSRENIGQDNIRVAREVLAKKQICVVSEDVGGNKGRKIVYHTNTNEIAILKVAKLRKKDWYPYQVGR